MHLQQNRIEIVIASHFIHTYLTKTPKVRIRALPTTFEALIDASMR